MSDLSYWQKAIEVTDTAVKSKSLIPLETNPVKTTNEFNSDFELRRLVGCFPKEIKQQQPPLNPFLPCDRNLIVSSFDNSHLLILNKFPVEKAHMLLITNSFQPQDGWLDVTDFNQIVKIEHDTKGLWFFNSSANAGASQPHRHLQLLPRSKEDLACPRQHWFCEQLNNPKRNNFLTNHMSIGKRENIKENSNGNGLYTQYIKLCSNIGLGHPNINKKPNGSYNLILTENWLCVIKRLKESNLGFSINALGFAGYFLATNENAISNFEGYGAEYILTGVIG